MQIRTRTQPWLLALLAVLTTALIFLCLYNRVQILAVYPDPGEQTSIYSRFGVTFNQHMDTDSVEAHFSVQPATEGSLTWDGPTLWFTPQKPLEPGQTYQLTISSGAESRIGRKLHAPITWETTVRKPDLLYLVLDSTGGDLWRYSFSTGTTSALTQTNAAVIDFSPNRSGDLIVFSQRNALGGYDLWLIDRDGAGLRNLLDCNVDHCIQPVWSIDNQWIAYVRESFNIDEEHYLPAQVWMLNAATGKTAPLYQQPEVDGHSPSFSPDGKHLAIYDVLQNAIRILELETSHETTIPTLYPSVGDWSPSGEELVFIDLMPGVFEPSAVIFVANITSKDLIPVLEEFEPNMNYDSPQWSPDGNWIAYAARPVDLGVGKDIWGKNLIEGDPIMLTDDPSAAFTNYRWDPFGERLVIQRYPIYGPISQASIWIWEQTTGGIHMLIENGARPEWLH